MKTRTIEPQKSIGDSKKNICFSPTFAFTDTHLSFNYFRILGPGVDEIVPGGAINLEGIEGDLYLLWKEGIVYLYFSKFLSFKIPDGILFLTGTITHSQSQYFSIITVEDQNPDRVPREEIPAEETVQIVKINFSMIGMSLEEGKQFLNNKLKDCTLTTINTYLPAERREMWKPVIETHERIAAGQFVSSIEMQNYLNYDLVDGFTKQQTYEMLLAAFNWMQQCLVADKEVQFQIDGASSVEVLDSVNFPAYPPFPFQI